MSSIKTCCICQRKGHQPRNCWYNDKQDKEAKDLYEIKRKNGKLIKTYKVRNLGTITTDEEKLNQPQEIQKQFTEYQKPQNHQL